MPRKILIVEDAELVVEGYRAYLKDAPLEILSAATLLEALEIFEANPDVELIALDALFPRDAGESDKPEPGMRCSGEKFLANVDYKGPVLACSSEDALNERLVRCGATRAVRKGRDVVVAILELLGLPPLTPAVKKD